MNNFLFSTIKCYYDERILCRLAPLWSTCCSKLEERIMGETEKLWDELNGPTPEREQTGSRMQYKQARRSQATYGFVSYSADLPCVLHCAVGGTDEDHGELPVPRITCADGAHSPCYCGHRSRGLYSLPAAWLRILFRRHAPVPAARTSRII